MLLIDNYDSFTYNLAHALARVAGVPPLVLRNDDAAGLAALEPSTLDAIVVSPGPGRPDRERDFGLSRWAFAQDRLPVLGICLGHQGMCQAAGARVDRAPEPVHGRLSPVRHGGTGLFAGIPSPFRAVRYHSLLVYDLPAAIEPLARTPDGLLMAARHRERPQWGVQFHPESIATEHGERLLANFLDLAGVRRGALRPPVASPPAPAPDPPYELVVRELPGMLDPEAAFAALFGADPAAYWLDSAGGGRFAMVGGAGPLGELVSYRVAEGEVVVRRGGEVRRHRETLFDHLDRMLAARRLPDPGLPTDFALGYVGYLGYELKADCGGAAVHRPAEPDAQLLFSDRALVLDTRDRRAWLLALATAEHPATGWLAEAAAVLAALPPLPEPVPPDPAAAPPVLARHGRDDYAALIAHCQEEIAAGESYEICLTNELSVPVAADPWETYRVLRRANPAPYAAFLRLPGCAVLSSSPERFLRVGDGRIESAPIKGTRPRGRTPAEDRVLAAELLGSEKERAENLMIVDLVRNDLGRVAEPGSVRVPRLFAVESYATVHQLVSTVTARLAPGASAVDCVRAAFPGGSVTGAPKLRTMEILDRLEGGPRGVYTGALGYLSLTGRADLSIVIRTLVVTPREVRIGVGGAITALADAAAEIEETRVKARALLAALPAAALAASPR